MLGDVQLMKLTKAQIIDHLRGEYHEALVQQDLARQEQIQNQKDSINRLLEQNALLRDEILELKVKLGVPLRS